MKSRQTKHHTNDINYINGDAISKNRRDIKRACSSKQIEYYKKTYPNLNSEISLQKIKFAIDVIIIDIFCIIYMQDTSASNPVYSLEKQSCLIRLLQTLHQKKNISEIEGDIKANPSPRYETEFEFVFDFLHAEIIYRDEKRIPHHVADYLKIKNGDPSEEVLQEYMTCLSDITRNCVVDLIENALENFEYLRPGVQLLGVEDTRKKPGPQKAISDRSVRFQFSKEPENKVPDNEEIKRPLTPTLV